MSKIQLTEEEKELLRDYFKTSSLILIRLKCQAIVMKDRGLTTEDIAAVVFRDVRSIERWIKDFLERRMASIFTGHKNNQNAGKLTREQKEEIKEVLAKPPSEVGLPKAFWDVPQLKQYVQAEFGVVYESVQSYHFLLQFSNLSFKYPDTFDFHRDEQAILVRMQEIREEIQPLLASSKWEVFAADEVRIILEAITRRAWLKRGERTVVKVDRKREYQNYLGLLNQKNFTCHIYELVWQKQEEILKALAQFLQAYPDKKICIIWDNARFHKGKLMQEALKRNGLLARVHLIALPPYAPDYNPIEHVWNTTKAKLANHQYEVFEKTKEAFKSLVLSQTFQYKI